MPVWFSEDEINSVLSVEIAVEAVDEAFRLLGQDLGANSTRLRLAVDGASSNARIAMVPTVGLMGVKVAVIVRRDVTQSSAVTLLIYDLPSGAFRAVMPAGAISQYRTGASTAVSCRYLARPESRVLAIFGAGRHARSQTASVLSVLPEINEVYVVGRSMQRAHAFAAEVQEQHGRVAKVVTAEQAAGTADVVVTITGSREPVFPGSVLRPGTHICAVGSNWPDKRELDKATLDNARVVVDSIEVAKLDGGDLLLNGVDPMTTEELGPIVAGLKPGRTNDTEITVFSSHGLAITDVMCARAVLNSPLIGQQLEIGVPPNHDV